MNKAEALTKLAALESETAALRKIIEAPDKLPGLWAPEKGDGYWFILGNGIIDCMRNTAQWDEGPKNHGNVFPSREIAEKAAPLMARANKQIAAHLQADSGAGEYARGDREWAAYLESGKWAATKIICMQNVPCCVHTLSQAEEAAVILNAEGIK